MEKATIHEFKTYLSLGRCADSMLFDSGTLVANIFATKGDYSVSVKLKVVGDVAVVYRNRVYHTYFDFPTGLKERIAEHPGNWQHVAGKQDVQINLNNWFEYQWVIHGPNYFCKSGCMLCEDDLHLMTEDGLKEEMLEVVNQVIEDNPVTNEGSDVIKIRDCEITRQNIEKTKKMLIAYGVSEDKVATVLQSIGYTLLDVELFPEVC